MNKPQVHIPHSARELLSGTLGADPYERIEQLRNIGSSLARAEGVAAQLEHTRHVLLAELANEYSMAHAGQVVSEAKLDRMARADTRYRAHCETFAHAIEERESLKYEYWAIRNVLEWDRTAIAHHNAMSRLEEPAS